MLIFMASISVLSPRLGKRRKGEDRVIVIVIPNSSPYIPYSPSNQQTHILLPLVTINLLPLKDQQNERERETKPKDLKKKKSFMSSPAYVYNRSTVWNKVE